jgi:site-specific DNA recombinase
MGRLVLNILLTFAQFERELAGERVRDRYEEKRRRGLFPGGCPPIGYFVKRGRLVLDPERAETVRRLFLDFPTMTASALARRLQSEGFASRMYIARHGKSRGGQKLWGNQILKILKNPVYAGHCFRRGELVQAQIEPLITLSQWQRVQEIAQSRMSPARDPDTNFLLGLLFDELGRPMGIRSSGQGRSPRVRHYHSRAALRRPGYAPQGVTVHAERIEKLAVSMVQSLLTDRIKLKETILSLGDYSGEIARSLGKGGLASRRVARMQGRELRELFLALVPRVEVAATELRMLICSFELRRFLAWDGAGLFRKAEVRPRGADRFRMIYAPAVLHCGHTRYLVPVEPSVIAPVNPRAELIELLRHAAELKEVLLSNRSKSIAQLAKSRRMGPVHFSRILRINYLAPDIQAAIMDGTQPADLTPHRILFSALPLDWAQQRHLLGFEAMPTSRHAAILAGKRERKDRARLKEVNAREPTSRCLVRVE